MKRYIHFENIGLEGLVDPIPLMDFDIELKELVSYQKAAEMVTEYIKEHNVPWGINSRISIIEKEDHE